MRSEAEREEVNMNEVNNAGKGLIATVLAGIILMFLKLMHYIEWSWLWVTIPFWGPIALVTIALILLIALKALAKVLAWIVKRI